MATLIRPLGWVPLLLWISLMAPGLAFAQGKAPPSWEELQQLIERGEAEAVVEGTEARLAQARAAGDEDEWARALIRAARLREVRVGTDAAVRFLREQPWPKGVVPRAALQLLYAEQLLDYSQRWEVRERERTEASGPVDLRFWTRDQVVSEVLRAYAEVWKERAQLGTASVQGLAEYIERNTYPAGIRDTLRDAVTYLWVETLADLSTWRAEQSHGQYLLDLGELLGGSPSVDLTDPAVHPLRKVAAILGDLEAWHRSAGRHEAALEARLERARRLHEAFRRAEDRTRIREHLRAELEGFRSVPWWAMGQLQLALLEREVGHEVRAHEAAKAGMTAYPSSMGGQGGAGLVRTVEESSYSLKSMSTDGPRRRSIVVMHRNLPVLYFRAYAFDLERRLREPLSYTLEPDHDALQRLISQQKPVASWSTPLPATPDFQEHQTFVTPPLSEPGSYVIVASEREDFRQEDNRLHGVLLTVTPWVVLAHVDSGRRVEARVLDGETGRPVPGVEVRIFLVSYPQASRELQQARTDSLGMAAFAVRPRQSYETFSIVAGRGKEAVAILNHQLSRGEWSPPEEDAWTLIYTDRSIYRPLQTLRWKVVAYRRSHAQAGLETLPNTRVTVSLHDASRAVVEKREVRTNAFGSAAGEFILPAGRELGAWYVATDPSGSTPVMVEEYKRPTFEVVLKDPSTPLRLNRSATLRGEARYYFGLPVVNGSVRWRVHRDWVMPSGQSPDGAPDPFRWEHRLVASGTSSLAEDGSFPITFLPQADERAAKGLSLRYSVEADVTDLGGETRSASREFQVGPVAVEARVEADVGFFLEGASAELRLVRSHLDGSPQPGRGSWRLVELQQPAQPVLPADEPPEPEPATKPQGADERILTPGDVLSPRWAGASPEDTLNRWADGAEQAKGTVEHDAEGLARLKVPALRPGAYRLRYETEDAFGQRFTTSREFLVVGASAPIALPAVLELERASVRVGETARLLAFSGFEGQPLFLELYQGSRRLQQRILTHGKDPAVLELPVTEALRGGFTVLLVGVRDHQLFSLSRQVAVPFDNKELHLEFTSFRDRLRPGGKETWQVTVRGPKGAPVEAGAAELLAYMYDRSLDLFGSFAPDEVKSLYPVRRNQVRFGVSLDVSDGTPIVEQRNWIRLVKVRPGSGSQRDMQRLGRRIWLDGWEFPEGDFLQFDNSWGGSLGSLSPNSGIPRDESLHEYVAPPSPAEEKGVEVVQDAPRTDFAETAFWIPQLLTGPEGSAILEFTVPDSVTGWRAWVHAVTRDLQGGSIQRIAISEKELMVRPSMPRFLREGDQAVLEVTVHNASGQPRQGTLTLDILDPQTQQSVLARFGVTNARQPFTVEAGKGTSLRFPLSAPSEVGTVAFRVTAQAGNLSDGELRPLPVLPGRMHLSQSRFVTLRDKDRKELSFEDLRRNDDPSRLQEHLVVTVDAQLFASVLEALPYLVEYPYECTEQTLNRFVSTSIVSSLYERYPAVARMAKALSERPTRFEPWDAADPNRKMSLEETPWLREAQGGAEPEQELVRVLEPAMAKAQRAASLAKLFQAQLPSGAFPWWPGGPASPFMTLYIAQGLARAAEYKVELPVELLQQTWDYLGRHYREEYAGKQMKEDRGWEFLTVLNYVFSSYPDENYTREALTAEDRRRILDFSFKHWKEHSPYLKGYLALTLARAGRMKDAELVWESVMASARTSSELGTTWAPGEQGWLWYNDATETQAFALRTLMELKPKDPRREGLVQGLLLDKKLRHWKSTRATAEAVYALVKYLEQEGALGVREDAKVTVGDRTEELVFEPDRYTGKKHQVVLSGAEVDPVKSSTVVVEKTTKGLAFASATWHFSTEKLPEEERGDFFQVSRRYFLREQSGKEAVLRTLAEGAKLVPGDEVEVQLSLRTKHEAEYVHLRDPRAAGLEPAGTGSGHQWDGRVTWYEETRDSGANFFFEWLPAGEYTFKYRLRASMAGTFRVGPATVQSMYAPEFTAYSAGAVLTVGSAHAR